MSVQRDTVARIEQQEAQRNQVRRNIESQIATLTACRKSLNHECVTGQWRISEADSTLRQGSVQADSPQ